MLDDGLPGHPTRVTNICVGQSLGDHFIPELLTNAKLFQQSLLRVRFVYANHTCVVLFHHSLSLYGYVVVAAPNTATFAIETNVAGSNHLLPAKLRLLSAIFADHLSLSAHQVVHRKTHALKGLR